MQSRPLGASGLTVSAVGLGTNYVGGHNLYPSVDEDEGVRLVQRALDLGITHVDTADVYGMGRSEELVGQAIKGRRDQVVLATKGGNPFGQGRSRPDNSPTYLRSALEASLRRLGTDHVDLYYIHRPDGTTPAEEAYGALMRFREEGLIRAGGLSNFAPVHVEAALEAGPVAALQSQYNLLQRGVELDGQPTTLEFCERHGIAFIPWGPLAYGLLGGRYTRDFRLAENDWRHRSGAFGPDTFGRNLDRVDRLKALAAEWQMSLPHLAVRWLLARPAVTSVIAGAKSAVQVESNAVAARDPLSAGQLHRVDEALAL